MLRSALLALGFLFVSVAAAADLPKPFTEAGLVEAIRDALKAREP